MTVISIQARSNSVATEPKEYAHYRAVVITIAQIAFRALFAFAMLCMTGSAIPAEYHATLLPAIVTGAIFLSAFFWTDVPRKPQIHLERIPPLLIIPQAQVPLSLHLQLQRG